MRVVAQQEDVEALLTREARAGLPLRRQLRLYFDPFAFFKDASCGTAWSREHARRYNFARRSLLLTYIRRWLVMAIDRSSAVISSLPWRPSRTKACCPRSPPGH